jgi:hypothetical protein
VTDMPEYGREPLERWLADHHRDLCDGMSQFIDPDAGLQEATALHAGHTSILSSIESHLDSQAGLAAILPSPAVAPQATTDTATAIMAADPAARLALRRHPVILAVILSHLTVRAVMIASETPGARDQDIVPDLVRVRDIARDLDIDHDVVRRFDLGYTIDNIARDLDTGGNIAHVLAIDLARDVFLTLTLDLNLDLARTHDSGLALAHDLNLALAHEIRDALVLDRVPDRALELARDIAHQTALTAGSALGITQVEGLAAGLLDGALDDFTQADLAHVDLSGRDLTGVRWSDWGTTWPPGIDIDALRARSRELAPGTGVYVVTNPGDIGKTFHHVPA